MVFIAAGFADTRLFGVIQRKPKGIAEGRERPFCAVGLSAFER